MTPAIPRTKSDKVGALADVYARAFNRMRAAEIMVEDMLDSLLDGWEHFEINGNQIDIYSATDAPAAVDALNRAGFRTVRIHDHGMSAFTKCACKARSHT